MIGLLLGGWLFGTVIIGTVAAENFFEIDRLLAGPSHRVFLQDVAQLQPGEARNLLRYVSSELNRLYFNVWGWVEFVLGITVLVLAGWLKQRKLVIGFGLMLAIVAVMAFYITPEITQVGRALDFVPRQPTPLEYPTFAKLHGAYSILDLVKLLIGIWMAVVLSRLRSKTSAYSVSTPSEASRD